MNRGTMSARELESIYGVQTSPYLIWAPNWVESSAGIRAIHLLCHALNMQGSKAFLVLFDPVKKSSFSTNPTLMTPVISSEQLRSFTSHGIPPIAVYPEDVIGNPLNAPVVVRVLWNYSGALGGPLAFNKSESIWAYSENIAKDYKTKTGIKPKVLFLPPVDPREFPVTKNKKPYQIIYAGKYRSFVGKPSKVGTLPSIEIFRSGKKKQSRSEVRRLIAEAQVLYSFENSSIVTEAILSGTPAGFIPNEFLGKIIAEKELGDAGSFFGDSAEAVEAARLGLTKARTTYMESISAFKLALEIFVRTTQKLARTSESTSLTLIPRRRSRFTKNRVFLAFEIARSKGLKIFLKEMRRFIHSKI